MIQKRHVILILLVALNLAVSVAYSASWNTVETWNFGLSSKGWNHIETWNFTLNSTAQWRTVETWAFSLGSKGWNLVEAWSFSLANETRLWNYVDETSTIITCVGWLLILAPALIIIFALAILMVVYAKRKREKEADVLKLV